MPPTTSSGAYRQGNYEAAISRMKGEASRVLGPAPRLVLAMSQYKTGLVKESRITLAAAVMAHDWTATKAVEQEGWIYHVLRREAEKMILTNLPAFLAGKYQPQDNDERMALVGVCQFTERYATLARLYHEAFSANARLADEPNVRFHAARAAALAGCGRGEDATSLNEAGRRRWRDQARRWLRADMTQWGKPQADTTSRERVKQILTQWQYESDLAGLREPAELLKFGKDEREDCISLWKEVKDILNRNSEVK